MGVSNTCLGNVKNWHLVDFKSPLPYLALTALVLTILAAAGVIHPHVGSHSMLYKACVCGLVISAVLWCSWIGLYFLAKKLQSSAPKEEYPPPFQIFESVKRTSNPPPHKEPKKETYPPPFQKFESVKRNSNPPPRKEPNKAKKEEYPPPFQKFESFSAKDGKQPHRHNEPIKKNNDEWMDAEARGDRAFIEKQKNAVIAGFLSLGEKEGWRMSQGNTSELGNRFVRHMLRTFWAKNQLQFSDYFEVIIATVKAFSPSVTKNEKGDYPRANVDDTITEWLDHAVSRLIGNVGKEFSPDGPFFEVLINSAQINGRTIIKPFWARILENKGIALERGQKLKEMENEPLDDAYDVFYSSKLTTPLAFYENYKKQHKKEPGEEVLRLINGLEYANLQKMKAQVTGNCWLKQRKRCVFLSFYLEILTRRPEITIEKSWDLAKRLYAKWKESTYEVLKEMMKTPGISPDIKSPAETKIASHLKKMKSS